MDNIENEAIKKVIEEAYIGGIHERQDERTARKGFHQDFTMFVLKDGTVDAVTLDSWFGRIEQLKADAPEVWDAKTTCTFEFIDVSDDAAVVKLYVYKGETHFSTDYMLLYKFKDGWKIVSKIFTVPS